MLTYCGPKTEDSVPLQLMDSRHLSGLPRAGARMIVIRLKHGLLQSSSPSAVFFSNHLQLYFLSRRDFVLSLHLPLSEAAPSCYPVGTD